MHRPRKEAEPTVGGDARAIYNKPSPTKILTVPVFPYHIHTVLTDNGMAFPDLPKNRNGSSRRVCGPHIFDRVCIANGIEHRLTEPYHPWTNAQAERMNRTIKDATVKTYHYDNLESLKTHVLTFVTA